VDKTERGTIEKISRSLRMVDKDTVFWTKPNGKQLKKTQTRIINVKAQKKIESQSN